MGRATADPKRAERTVSVFFTIGSEDQKTGAAPRCHIFGWRERIGQVNTPKGLKHIKYEETEAYRLTRGFLNDHQRMLDELMK